MPKIIDHDKRKEEILYMALQVFSREGYKDSNLSLIAHECGISRPTIYQYFRDKEEIYYYAVKLFTGKMFIRYAEIAWDDSKTVVNRLKRICRDIIETAAKNRDALTSLVDVMIQLKKEGRDFSDIIMRRTAKLIILFKRLLSIGVHSNMLIKHSVNEVSTHLLHLLESFCFQMAFLESYDPEASIKLINIYIESLKAGRIVKVKKS
ncbi:MAG: TetR/AcrR family transcriptional regulator [Spirochaetales bacterium]|nr:TetR/AcrR family transcriptional regulator [Spirochaetales bacterium]